MTMMLDTKVALVTGAGNGIGAAAARLLCERKIHTLILLDLSTAAIDTLATELQGSGTRVLCCSADISDRAALRAALKPIVARTGKIDILVNSAGIADENEPEQEDIWRRVLDVNVHGTYFVTLEALDAMPDGGRIVNVASILGRAGNVRNTAYCTSKHAMLGFTKSLALDVASRKITVNAVLPAWVDTPMLRREMGLQAEKIGAELDQMLRNARKKIPLRSLVQSGEVAAMIGYLVSDAASSVTAQSFTIDGGFTCGV
uniref:Putative oxidoreductase n=1 Tax=uncultured bacterium pEAF66 TaxID=480414 RepID=B0LFU4_9BACT|nr:putative oxidoreductase [uncultured bacterium pEAF66]